MVKFIVHPDLHEPTHPDFRKASWASWLLSTIIIFVFLYSVYFTIYYPEDQVKQRINIIGFSFMIVMAAQMRFYRNIHVILLQLSIGGVIPTMISIYNTGGIYSMDIVWLFLNIFCAFIVSTLTSGLIVTFASMVYVAYLYYKDTYINDDRFKHYIENHNSTHNVITIIFVIILTSTVLILFVQSLEKANQTIQKLKEQQIQDLEEKLKAKTNEISMLRGEIAKDFHDEMGNKLASITLLAQSVGLKLKNKALDEVPEMLDTIEKRSSELYYGTKDFIWSIDFKSDYVYELFLYLREFGEVFFNELDIDFKSESNVLSNSSHRLEVNTSRHLVYMIKELFTNAAKHSKCSKVSFTMYIHTNEETLSIEIEDDGIGFDPQLNSSRGLLNIHKRIIYIDGLLHIESTPNAGSLFKIEVDLNKLPVSQN